MKMGNLGKGKKKLRNDNKLLFYILLFLASYLDYEINFPPSHYIMHMDQRPVFWFVLLTNNQGNE